MIVTDDSKSNGKGITPFEESITETPPMFNEGIASSGSTQIESGVQPAARIHESASPILPGGIDDAPPEFSTWDAQYHLTSRGDIVSA
jgi:hypothetical protein